MTVPHSYFNRTLKRLYHPFLMIRHSTARTVFLQHQKTISKTPKRVVLAEVCVLALQGALFLDRPRGLGAPGAARSAAARRPSDNDSARDDTSVTTQGATMGATMGATTGTGTATRTGTMGRTRVMVTGRVAAVRRSGGFGLARGLEEQEQEWQHSRRVCRRQVLLVFK